MKQVENINIIRCLQKKKVICVVFLYIYKLRDNLLELYVKKTIFLILFAFY